MENDYKEEFSKSHTELLHIVTNSQDKLDNQTDGDIIKNFLDEIENPTQNLSESISLLRLAILNDRVYNSTIFYEKDILFTLKDIIINWATTDIKGIAADIIFECFTKLPLSRLEIFNDINFFKDLYMQCDHHHLFSYMLYGKIATISLEARDYVFNVCGVNNLLESYIPGKKHGEWMAWLISCCSYFDTEFYPQIIDFAFYHLKSETEKTNIELRSFIFMLYAVCSNGHGSAVYENQNFNEEFIDFLINTDNIITLLQSIQILRLITRQIHKSLEISLNSFSLMLRHQDRRVLSMTYELIQDSIAENEDAAQNLVDLGIISFISEILQNDQMSVKENTLKVLDLIVANIEKPAILDVLPFLLQFLDEDSEEYAKIAISLYYRFFDVCDDKELVASVKENFINEGGMDLLNDLLDSDSDKLSELAESLMDLIQEK